MKKGALLLLKNEFKQSLRNKVQLVGLIFLVLLVSTIFSVMRSTTVRVVDQYEILNKESNLHDFIIDLNNSEINGKNENDDSYDFLKQDAIENAAHNPENRFYWTRIETRTFSLANKGHQRLLKAITYDKNALIDKLIVTEGKSIGENEKEAVAKEKQVVLNKEFAENNGIKIGSVIRLQADDKGDNLLVSSDDKSILDPANSNFNWFKVVGLGVSADFTMTKIDESTIIPNKTREGLVYVDPLQFGLFKRNNYRYKESKNSFWDYDKTQELLTITSNKDREVYFAGKFFNQTDPKLIYSQSSIKDKIAKLSDQLLGKQGKWWNTNDPFKKWNNLDVYDLLSDINIDSNIEKNKIVQNQLKNQEKIEQQLVEKIKEIFAKQQVKQLKWNDSWTFRFFYQNSTSGKEEPFDFTAKNIDITNPVEISFQVIANNNTNDTEHEKGNVFASDKIEFKVNYNPGNPIEHDSSKEIEKDVYDLIRGFENTFNESISSFYIRKGSNQNINNIKIEIVKYFITQLNQKNVYSFQEIKNMKDFLENNLNVTVAETDDSVFNDRFDTAQLQRNLKIGLSLYDLETRPIDIEIHFKNNITKSFYSTIDRSEKLVYGLFDPSYKFNLRVSSLNSKIKGYKRLMELLLILTIIIAATTLALVIRKAIDNSKVQIGILKSLGYSNGQILITSLSYPMIGSFCSALLTYFTSLPLQKLVIKIFSQYYNLDFGVFYFSWTSFIYTIILTFGFLSLIALIVTLIAIWKKPIDLIKYDSNSNTSWMARKIKFIARKRNFNTRFKVAMFSSSIGKISAVSVTMLLGTILMTAAITGPKIMKDNKLSTYAGLKYNSIIEYESPIFNSPLSFYKTYNPNIPAWGDEINRASTDPIEIKKADNKIINEILENSINSEYYSPYFDANIPGSTMPLGMSIAKLPWKGFTSAFLDKLSNNRDKDVASMICSMAWPDYQKIITAFSSLTDMNDHKNNALNYDQFRNFYRIYHSTIGLYIQKHLRLNNTTSISNSNLFDKNELKKFVAEINASANANGEHYPLTDSDPSIDNFSFEASNFRIKDDIDFVSKPSSYFKDPEIVKTWIKKFTLWYTMLFYENTGQCITQGIYTKAPYFVRQQMVKSFKTKGSFNVFFNVLPFDKKTDELGTFFEASASGNKDFTFKVYGIQDDSRYIELTNDSGENLNRKIANHTFQSTNAPVKMVINETIAQKLKLKTGDIVQWDVNGNEMIKTPTILNPKPVSSTDILNNFDIPLYEDPGGAPINNNLSWSFDKMKNKYLVPSGDDLYNPEMMGNLSTNINKEVSQGNIAIDKFKTNQKFEVVGIHKGYGEAKAYVAKDAADTLLKYNLSRQKLFEIFANQWSGHQIDLPNNKNYQFPNYNQSNNPLAPIDKETTWNLYKFQKQAINDPIKNDVLKIFNNEYPVFNFKVSSIKKIDNIADINSGFTTYQGYGDFTQIGLNGGIDPNTHISYSGYGKGAAKFILPLSVHREILDQITSLSNLILIMFAILALIVSFTIILLTSNLIIYENRKTIATMKVLGYNDKKITNVLIGMYLPILAITFTGGFVAGWYIVKAILYHLALTTSWVLPLAFVWWLPVIAGVIVLGMYILTFIAGWFSLKRINPLYALKVND